MAQPVPSESYQSHTYPPSDQPPPSAAYPPPSADYPPPPNADYPPPPNADYPPPQNAGYPPPQDAAYPPPPNAGYQPPPPGASPYPPPGQPVGGAGAMGHSGWMPAPAAQAVINCPPGLEYLTQVDQLLVHQQVELLEAFTGFETNNKYAIKNTMGQQVYFAAEDTDCCTRMCCGANRQFDMKILDNTGNEVMHLYRPLRCRTCWCPCCLQELEVTAPPGTPIGYVEQDWSLCVPKFSIKNAAKQTILKIEGPCCTWSICGDVEFEVQSKDGDHQVGKVSKQWSGLAREMFTDADHFGITFPMDMDVHAKATCLAACFLIDFMFFEDSGNRKDADAPGMFG